MKKTKCDGESPCKRCKDDGLVCTAGSRKKTEFKQLPRGYAEVLENTQYALIATVQKLYTMIRNNESWDLGEPEMNDRGQPVIHDIASKLGCIRPSPDLPNNFPEGAEDFAELQAQLQAARSDANSEDTSDRKYSEDSAYSPALDRTDRASSSESDHSSLSKDYSQKWSQQRQAAKIAPHAIKPAPLNLPLKTSFDEEVYQPRASLDSSYSIPSPIYTDFQTESPMFRNSSPFSPWSGQDDFLGPAHALDLTAHYMRAQQMQAAPRSSTIGSDFLKAMQLNDGLNFADGTIRPTMLDCNTSFDMSDQMDSIIYTGDYEGQIGMA
jgi:flagellar motor protein MotB